ncbi:hypothetical protein [Mucilaginibacter sp. OK098]|uniref:hypothetical protein n=1 Tax=Mucilaginibacter sp. OK098 TaxID=1855297 RepID=UPI0009234F68|nr:hypothetical protein [Mucilaginibacter sp. OK098]SHN16452.1 hypothetical protein SAMN05216524_10616 [Mucilaginibacter sp. OK098]
MEEIFLRKTVFDAYRLSNINQYLVSWDLSPVEGKGIHLGAMHTKYGHIQIKMYKSSNQESKMIWNLTQEQLPDEYGAKTAIKKVLEYFIDYFAGIKGESIALIFEINDGSYHPVDSQAIGYMFAAMYALINCFDKDHIKFKEDRVWRNF